MPKLPFQIDLESTDSAVPPTPRRTCNPDWCRSHRGELNAALAMAEKLRARAAHCSSLAANLYNQTLITEMETLAVELDGEAWTLELESCPMTAPLGSDKHH